MKALMIDALSAGKGRRQLARDVIGAGPRWICGLLEASDAQCRIQLAEEFLRGRKTAPKPDLVLVSAMTMDMAAVKRIGRRVRKIYPEALRILGGPISTSPLRALKTSDFNLAVIGEGEKPMESILRGDDPEGIPGIAYTDDSGVLHSFPAKPLDEAGYNRYVPSVERIRDYPTFFASRVYVEILRGCSNFNRTTMPLADGRECTRCVEGCGLARCPEGIPPGCGFCSVPSTFGPPKSRDIGLIEEEIGGLVERGVRRIVLSAPDLLDYKRGEGLRDPRTPRPDYERLDELLGSAKEAAGEARIFLENVKASLLDDEAAGVIAKNLPGAEIHIGCETGDERHSLALGRPSTPAETWRAVRIAKAHGLTPYVYFIHGLPGQTPQTARSTARLMGRMAPFVEKITVYRFKPLPGSAFEFEAPGPPAWQDGASRLIWETAKQINLKKKEAYIGRTMEVVVAEMNFERGDEVLGFPERSGPLVTFRGSPDLIGKRIRVRVVRAISDRLLFGEIFEAAGNDRA